MEIYQTEDQQVEAIKAIWEKYKRLAIALVIIMLVFIGGSSYFRHHARNQTVAASDLYQGMLISVLQHDKQTAKTNGELLLSGYKYTPYPELGALLLAKIAVEEEQYDEAIKYLKWAINKKPNKGNAAEIAQARLARILKSQGEYQEALALIDKPAKNYQTLYAEQAGDLYLMQGNRDAAKQAYVTAFKNLPDGLDGALLKMKLMDMGVNVGDLE